MSWTENSTVMIPDRGNFVGKAVDFMLENIPPDDKRWDSLKRSMEILHGGFYTKMQDNPYTNKLWNYVLKDGARLINQDWIAREINYLGFRL
jgi:hypothetical protein